MKGRKWGETGRRARCWMKKKEKEVCVCGGGGAERSHRHTGKRGSYSAATGENPTHESVGK